MQVHCSLCVLFPGHGGLHADSELGQLDGASWAQTEGLDERKAQVSLVPRDSSTHCVISTVMGGY